MSNQIEVYQPRRTFHFGHVIFDERFCKRAYTKMNQTHYMKTCWACGRNAAQRPSGWFAPFLIERAHIVNKPRREDRRTVILLCSLCHKQSHGETFPAYSQENPLTLEGMLYLKLMFDNWFYDREFMQRCSIRRLPEPVMPIGTIGRNVGILRNWLARNCLLYTSPSPRDATLSRMPSSA